MSQVRRYHYSFRFQHKTHSLLLETLIMNLKKIQENKSNRVSIQIILIDCFDILILILADHINHVGELLETEQLIALDSVTSLIKLSLSRLLSPRSSSPSPASITVTRGIQTTDYGDYVNTDPLMHHQSTTPPTVKKYARHLKGERLQS